MAKIIKTIWFTSVGNTLGIVLTEDKITGKNKARIGAGYGQSDTQDQKMIMDYGAKLTLADAEEIVAHLKGGK